jgi:hypothetical protein
MILHFLDKLMEVFHVQMPRSVESNCTTFLRTVYLIWQEDFRCYSEVETKGQSYPGAI